MYLYYSDVMLFCVSVCKFIFCFIVVITKLLVLMCSFCLGDLVRAARGKTEKKERRFCRTVGSQVQGPVVSGEYNCASQIQLKTFVHSVSICGT